MLDNYEIDRFGVIHQIDVSPQTAPLAAIHRLASELSLSIHSGRSWQRAAFTRWGAAAPAFLCTGVFYGCARG